MDQSNIIFHKLEVFINKFYTNELIRGVLLFVGLGLMYFIFTIFVEYFLWLKPLGRTLLFCIFVGVELFLLIRFILFPLFQLFQLKKGIGYSEASKIIGNHFPEVNDKLINFLQLSSDQNKSELLFASIEQKANLLQPIPFGKAINFKNNQRYLPLAIFPIFLLASFYISGNSKILSQSLNRVVHFKEQFLPPAPFKFVVLNSALKTEQDKDFIIQIKTVGNVVPDNTLIFIGEESYFMEKGEPGEFHFLIEKPVSNVSFHFEANAISSTDYELEVISIPAISNFEMRLNFPSYLNKKSELIKGNGNAIVPEGTRVTWNITTHSTQNINWKNATSVFSFRKFENRFVFNRTISQSTEYQIVTSNVSVLNYEKLNYQLSVVKDQFPTIFVNSFPDSLKADKNYVLGQIADDYGLSKLKIFYYPKNSPNEIKLGTIAIKSPLNDRFVFAFPGELPVEEGVFYEYYFEVFDNDIIHNFKSTKSSLFSTHIATNSEKENQVFQQQNDNIGGLEKSLKNQQRQISELDKLQKSAKEKSNLEFNDQQKMNDFLKNQMKQDQMMKDFLKKMKENLDKSDAGEQEELKEKLKKRLDDVNADLEKNKKLLEELKDLNDKINQEDLLKQMDKFEQNAKNQSKSLEQLVELTKKYYVEKKAEQIKEKLEKLAAEQEKLSNNDARNTLEKQQEINKKFDDIGEELKDLEKENKELAKPLDIPVEKDKQKSIDEDLKKASEELQNGSMSTAKPKQKSASKKMMQMAQKMEQGMSQDESEEIEEDIVMLRQILDNLLSFSFSQEDLMGKFDAFKIGSPSFNKNLMKQQDLKVQFKHIDDSLFSMSLRNPNIAENITKEIGNVQYNLDHSLESFADAQISKGVSHQQYSIASANRLADFLSDVLNSMQMAMSGTGQGKPKPGNNDGMQLSDIIKKQGDLGDKMKEGIKKGDKPGVGKPGDKGSSSQKSGTTEKSNESGKEGQNGQGGESDAKAIMEIYKEQKQLRDALQNELEKHNLGGQGKNALEEMKQIEKQLLNKGFNNETLQRILNIKQELLKLNNALQEQGEETKRQSESSKKEFNKQSNALPDSLLDYLNSIEILNRQSLPLRPNYNLKTQKYFNSK